MRDPLVVRGCSGFTVYGRQDQLVDGLAIRGLELGEDGLELSGYLLPRGQRALTDEGSDENARRLTDGREVGDRLQLPTQTDCGGLRSGTRVCTACRTTRDDHCVRRCVRTR